MKNTQEIFNVLKDKYPDSVPELISSPPFDSIITISPLQIAEVCLFLRDNEELKFDSLLCLSGVDDANGKTTKDENGDIKIEGGTLSVFYHLESTKFRHKVTLKASTSREKPEIASVALIWRHADWHER